MQLNAITRKSALMAILLLVAILVAVALRYYFTPFALESANCEYQGRGILLVVTMFVYLFTGLIEGKMLTRSCLVKGYCTLPMPLFGILSCGIFFSPHTLTAATTSLLFALALYLLIRSLHVTGETDSVFFASILLGTTVLLYPPSMVLIGVIPLAIFILALSLRQSILMIVGYVIPFLATSYVMWYRGCDFWQLGNNIIESLSLPRIEIAEKIPYGSIILIFAVVVLLICGGVYAIARPNKMFMLVRTRRAFHLFLWVSLLSLTILFVPSCDLVICAIISVPLAILLSFVFDVLPNNYSTILYWVLLAFFVMHLFVE